METDARIVELCHTIEQPGLRRELLTAYLGFPFFDISTFPLAQGAPEELEVIKVDRISPVDANSIRRGGAENCLKGIELGHFGAFFSRAYRENDYLWGRLHAADRLVDMVLSAVPDVENIDADAIKKSLFLSILNSERQHLEHSEELLDALRAEIDEV